MSRWYRLMITVISTLVALYGSATHASFPFVTSKQVKVIFDDSIPNIDSANVSFLISQDGQAVLNSNVEIDGEPYVFDFSMIGSPVPPPMLNTVTFNYSNGSREITFGIKICFLVADKKPLDEKTKVVLNVDSGEITLHSPRDKFDHSDCVIGGNWETDSHLENQVYQ